MFKGGGDVVREYRVVFFSGLRAKAYRKHQGEWVVCARSVREAKERAVSYLYLLGLNNWFPVVTGVVHDSTPVQ